MTRPNLQNRAFRDKIIRSKSSRRGVTPAIATMILLSGTLVLALLVGAYTFSIFGSSVKFAKLSLVIFYEGVTSDNQSTAATSSFRLSLNNAGNTESISSLTVTVSGTSNSITSWSTTPGAQPADSFFVSGNNALPGGVTSSFTIYPVHNPSISINSGATYDYVISFSNGQSISGVLIVQF